MAMFSRRRLAIVKPAPIRIVIGRTEFRHLLARQTIKYHQHDQQVTIELSPDTKGNDPPEARELVFHKRDREPC